MRPDDFRRLALALPETLESEHMDHPDFRVGGKIFASLGPANDWGMVKLTPQKQAEVVRASPEVFEPAQGAWGARGYTRVWLAKARKSPVEDALLFAWRLTAPKKVLKRVDPAE